MTLKLNDMASLASWSTFLPIVFRIHMIVAHSEWMTHFYFLVSRSRLEITVTFLLNLGGLHEYCLVFCLQNLYEYCPDALPVALCCISMFLYYCHIARNWNKSTYISMVSKVYFFYFLLATHLVILFLS